MRLISIALAVSLWLPAFGGDTLTVTFVGDVLLDRGVRQHIERHGPDALFSAGVDSVFRQSDLVVANLECPATKLRQPLVKRFCFRGEPEWLQVLKAHGITHLNLANNHSIDQGREGLMDTRAHILQAGMTPAGAGRNMQEAAEPVLLASQPRRVWLVVSNRLTLENFAYLPDQPCVSQEPMDSLLQRISRLRRQDPSCCILVSLHWGAEHQLQPTPRQRIDARRLIDAGADALICHHTHTLQTIEQYRTHHPIYYSIGNFIFDPSRPLNREACMVQVRVTKEKTDIETIPVWIQHCTPTLVTSMKAVDAIYL